MIFIIDLTEHIAIPQMGTLGTNETVMNVDTPRVGGVLQFYLTLVMAALQVFSVICLKLHKTLKKTDNKSKGQGTVQTCSSVEVAPALQGQAPFSFFLVNMLV